ncbi:MAG: alpha-amylase family protein [Tannerella sp.]|jgi:glycosidase|nr:alpha-amylase family protein [Tannerella sp.]
MKTIIYQTFPRLFGNFNGNLVKDGSISQNGCGKFNSYTDKALYSIKDLGVTHLWFTGVIRHATCTDYSAFGLPKDHSAVVKGMAGSPYAIKDYYDVCPDLAENIPNRMAEFEALVRRAHDAGMKVIIDFVPNHVARSYQSVMKPAYVEDFGHGDHTNRAFDPMNNFYYLPGQSLLLSCEEPEEDFEYSEFPAKATGNDCFKAEPDRNDWYETVKLNYGIDYQNDGRTYFSPVPDTWEKMLDILLFWTGKDVDGFRCDMAEMVPVEFWDWIIPRVKSRKNVKFIAEVYNPQLYRDFINIGGFDYLYDKVGMYDTLRAVIADKSSANALNACWQATGDIQKNMLYFLENHDEQRITSDFFARKAEIAIPAFAYLTFLNINPVMIYNGQELGERGMDGEGFSGYDGKTSIFDYWSMETVRNWADTGKFDGKNLPQSQLELRETYKRILTLANREKALYSGSFYGLDFCNTYPSDRITAFLRKFEDELLLVIINFDEKECEVAINIPQNAFEVLNIKDNTVSKTTNLLTGEETVSALTQYSPYYAKVSASSYNLLRFKLLQ